MSSPYYEVFTAGETDLHEIMQLCSNVSSNHSVPPDDSSQGSDQTQPMILDDDIFNTLGVQLNDNNLAFDVTEHTPPQQFSRQRAKALDSAVQIRAQRCKQIQEFGISLDISNALATPMRNHSSYPVLESQLREELVAIYFDHVHPLCPVIDEQNFWWHFIALSEDEFFETFPAIMFNAMLFAAFGHATDGQVRRAGFTSINEVQSQYSHILSEIYDDAQSQVFCEMGEVVLAKVALLLSLWCPPKLEIAVSSLWAERAMYHTKRYLRKNPSAWSMPLPKRRDILVWCCVTRKIFISYSLRRPYRFCMEEPLCDPEDLRSEFDRELQFHNFCSPVAKVRMVEDFVTMCKLSQNFRNILYLQSSMLPTLRNPEYSITTRDPNEAELHNCLSRYLRTAEAEAELVDLIELHEFVKCEGAGVGGGERASEVVAARTRSYVLQIMTFSSIVSLYQFTISVESSTWDRSCYRTALSKLFDASKKVACIVEHMLSDVPIEAIPGTLLAWTTSPMIPLLVEQNCRKFGLPGLSAYEDSDSDHDSDSDNDSDSEDFEHSGFPGASKPRAREVASLLELTSRMAPRFHSAHDAWELLQNADHILCLNAASADPDRVRQTLRLSMESVVDDLAIAERGGSWDLLIKAMKFVDSEIVDGNCLS